MRKKGKQRRVREAKPHPLGLNRAAPAVQFQIKANADVVMMVFSRPITSITFDKGQAAQVGNNLIMASKVTQVANETPSGS